MKKAFAVLLVLSFLLLLGCTENDKALNDNALGNSTAVSNTKPSETINGTTNDNIGATQETMATTGIDSPDNQHTSSQQVVISDNKFDGFFNEYGMIDKNGQDVKSGGWKRTSKFYPLQDTAETLYVALSEKARNFNVVLYNADKEFLSVVTCNNGLSAECTIRKETTYFRIYAREFEGDAYISTVQPSNPVDYSYKEQGNAQTEIKKGVAFGTSLTYRAKTTTGYLAYLPKLSNTTFDNQGVGSSKIYGDAADSILNKILNYDDYADRDIVLIEGFVNDWYYKSPLGIYTDTETTSVCGSLRTAINHIKGKNPDIKIYVVLDHYGQAYNNLTLASTVKINNITQAEYYEECVKVCKSLGVTAIKQYETSGISELTPQYFMDQIHLNEMGAEQSAKAIWNGMEK